MPQISKSYILDPRRLIKSYRLKGKGNANQANLHEISHISDSIPSLLHLLSLRGLLFELRLTIYPDDFSPDISREDYRFYYRSVLSPGLRDVYEDGLNDNNDTFTGGIPESTVEWYLNPCLVYVKDRGISSSNRKRL